MTASEQNVRAVVVDALVGMVSGVTGMVPPTDTPLPDFIQGPVDRAVSKIEVARAADKARIAALVEALESMTCAYRMAIQAGHARITALGGDCDSVDQMLADFPDYGRSVELYKSCRAALAQQGKEQTP